MHKLLATNIHSDVRHLAFNTEEQQITNLQIRTPNGCCCRPELAGRAWYVLPSPSIRILHQPTAIESSACRSTIKVWHTDLLQRNGCSARAHVL